MPVVLRRIFVGACEKWIIAWISRFWNAQIWYVFWTFRFLTTVIDPWSCRCNMVLSFRHTLYSPFLLSFIWGLSQYSNMWNALTKDHQIYCRVEIIWRFHLGILCIPSFSPLSIGTCHNILPFERASTPLTEPGLRISLIRLSSTLHSNANGY